MINPLVSPAEAIDRPSRKETSFTTSAWSGIVDNAVFLATDQILTIPFPSPETSFAESGEKLRQVTVPSCPLRVATTSPAGIFQTPISLPTLAAKSFPSGEKR